MYIRLSNNAWHHKMAKWRVLFLLCTLLNDGKCGQPPDAGQENMACLHESCNVKMENNVWSPNLLQETSNYSKLQEMAAYIFIVIIIAATWQMWKRYCESMEQDSKVEAGEFSEPVRYRDRLIYPGDWIRSLEGIEYIFAYGSMKNTYGVNVAYFLRSKKPIEGKVMKAALTAVTRQYPLLQMCIQFRFFGVWYKRIRKMVVDFTTITGDPTVEFEKRFRFKLNTSQGPLWKAALVNDPKISGQSNVRNFQSALIFNCCHSIVDGSTMNLIAAETIRFYNEIKSEQSTISSPPIFSLPLGNKIPSWSSLEIFLEACKMAYDNLSFKRNIQFIAPRNISTGGDNKIRYDNITLEETAKIKDLCKSQNATINSFVTTAFATAFVQTVNMFSGSVLNKMEVAMGHAVNVRQFLKFDGDKLYGCYVNILMVHSKIDLQKNGEFWDEAKRFQAEIRLRINENVPFKSFSQWKALTVLKALSVYIQPFFSQNYCNYHVISTNLGDISRSLPPAKEQDYIEIYDYRRSFSGADCMTPIILHYETFRDVLKFSIDIKTQLINEEPAEYLFSTFMNTIRVLCRDEGLSS